MSSHLTSPSSTMTSVSGVHRETQPQVIIVGTDHFDTEAVPFSDKIFRHYRGWCMETLYRDVLYSESPIIEVPQ